MNHQGTYTKRHHCNNEIWPVWFYIVSQTARPPRRYYGRHVMLMALLRFQLYICVPVWGHLGNDSWTYRRMCNCHRWKRATWLTMVNDWFIYLRHHPREAAVMSCGKSTYMKTIDCPIKLWAIWFTRPPIVSWTPRYNLGDHGHRTHAVVGIPAGNLCTFFMVQGEWSRNIYERSNCQNRCLADLPTRICDRLMNRASTHETRLTIPEVTGVVPAGDYDSKRKFIWTYGMISEHIQE